MQVDRDWNSWDDSPRTVGEHIEQYRQKLAQTKEDESNEPSIDFFQVSVWPDNDFFFNLHESLIYNNNKLIVAHILCSIF